MHSLFVASLGLLTACGLVPTVGAPIHGARLDGRRSSRSTSTATDPPRARTATTTTGRWRPARSRRATARTTTATARWTTRPTRSCTTATPTSTVGAPRPTPCSRARCPTATSPPPGDCDDTDPAVHPETDDWCDGVDSDCDGTTDEDEVIWYADGDQDGYGGVTGEVSCKPLEGHLLTSGDCDDADPLVHPDVADDDCDEQDDDCDGQTDEDSELVSWHYDLDDDTYGAAAFSIESCDQPYPGMITDGSDCDDTDAAIHPGPRRRAATRSTRTATSPTTSADLFWTRIEPKSVVVCVIIPTAHSTGVSRGAIPPSEGARRSAQKR
jgi:hypothetical protein